MKNDDVLIINLDEPINEEYVIEKDYNNFMRITMPNFISSLRLLYKLRDEADKVDEINKYNEHITTLKNLIGQNMKYFMSTGDIINQADRLEFKKPDFDNKKFEVVYVNNF